MSLRNYIAATVGSSPLYKQACSMIRYLKETLKNLYTVLMYVLIILAIIAIIGLMMGIRPRILVTDSMHPSVYKGSLVLLNIDTPWEEIEEGNIIAFRSGATEVMHRVKSITNDGMILKPDNGEGENFVTKDMYVGKEIIAFPYIGGMLKPILQNGKSKILLAAVILIIIGSHQRKKEKRRRKRQKLGKLERMLTFDLKDNTSKQSSWFRKHYIKK